MSVLRRRVDQILETIWPGAVAGQIPVYNGIIWDLTTIPGSVGSMGAIYVDVGAAAGGDGSQSTPFNTIQEACTYVATLPTSTVTSPNVIFIAPGFYDEDVTLVGTDHYVMMLSAGMWTLGGGGAAGNFTWSFSGAGSCGLAIHSYGINSSVSPFVTDTRCSPLISGSFFITSAGGGGTMALNLGASVVGVLDGTGINVGDLVSTNISKCYIGSINATGMYLWDLNDVVVATTTVAASIYSAFRCKFGVITLSGSMFSTVSVPSGFIGCNLTGNITVAALDVPMDGVSYFHLKANNMTTIGGDPFVYDQSTNGLITYRGATTLLDDAVLTPPIPTIKAGWGTVMVDDDAQFARFTFSAAGVVTLRENTAGVVNTDTDTLFCIFYDGTNVQIRNRLGAPAWVRWEINYSS